jgi:hypothetical protein
MVAGGERHDVAVNPRVPVYGSCTCAAARCEGFRLLATALGLLTCPCAALRLRRTRALQASKTITMPVATEAVINPAARCVAWPAIFYGGDAWRSRWRVLALAAGVLFLARVYERGAPRRTVIEIWKSPPGRCVCDADRRRPQPGGGGDERDREQLCRQRR